MCVCGCGFGVCGGVGVYYGCVGGCVDVCAGVGFGGCGGVFVWGDGCGSIRIKFSHIAFLQPSKIQYQFTYVATFEESVPTFYE